MCAGASTVTMIVAIASTSVGLPEFLGWQDELSTPPLTPLDTMRGVADFASVPKQQPSSQIGPALPVSLRLMPFILWVLHR